MNVDSSPAVILVS